MNKELSSVADVNSVDGWNEYDVLDFLQIWIRHLLIFIATLCIHRYLLKYLIAVLARMALFFYFRMLLLYLRDV